MVDTFVGDKSADAELVLGDMRKIQYCFSYFKVWVGISYRHQFSSVSNCSSVQLKEPQNSKAGPTHSTLMLHSCPNPPPSLCAVQASLVLARENAGRGERDEAGGVGSREEEEDDEQQQLGEDQHLAAQQHKYYQDSAVQDNVGFFFFFLSCWLSLLLSRT